MPIMSGKAGWVFAANEDPSIMPEIAESVVSREEEDFEEIDKVHGIGTSLKIDKKYNSSFMVTQSEDLNRPKIQTEIRHPESVEQSLKSLALGTPQTSQIQNPNQTSST